jgi:hypothetical protein
MPAQISPEGVQIGGMGVPCHAGAATLPRIPQTAPGCRRQGHVHPPEPQGAGLPTGHGPRPTAAEAKRPA